ncbi:MAG TPA: bifunctional nuclease family protein [Candidatus Omnitrophota bacterium]|nr:bifunctional nuclease family protein [Candidatus Omnitrophota bacterium]
MIQVELSKIIIDEKHQDQIIVLKEKNGDRQFPIVIGFLEASSIKMKLSGIEPPRPMTHDLLVAVIDGLGATLDRLVIDKMVNNTFHAKLEFKFKNGKKKIVDARPSDGVALAVRTNAAIFVEEDVMKKAALFSA